MLAGLIAYSFQPKKASIKIFVMYERLLFTYLADKHHFLYIKRECGDTSG
nr:hypothetical protein [Candidatus Enterovibrio escacola]